MDLLLLLCFENFAEKRFPNTQQLLKLVQWNSKFSSLRKYKTQLL